MEKLLISVLAAAVLYAGPAYAETITAVKAEDTVTIEQRDTMSDSLIVTCYDERGTLVYASSASSADGKYTLTLPGTYSTVKAFDINKETYDIEFASAEPSAEPAVQKLHQQRISRSQQESLSTRRIRRR